MPGPAQPFVKGQSGNPSGRPKKTDAEREAEGLAKKLSPRAIERLGEIMESEDEHAAVKAASTLLDRALGKPVQAITAEVEHRTDADATHALIRSELGRLLGQLRPREVVNSTAEVAALPAPAKDPDASR